MRVLMLLPSLVTISLAASLDGYNYGLIAPVQDNFIGHTEGNAPTEIGSNSYSIPAAALAKEFYTYSAPENAFSDDIANRHILESLRRSLRIVFIRTPENNALENAILQLAKSANEQHTAIYVLNKQPDVGDLTNRLNALNYNEANRPEVHFVKYRTQADAENAQRTIQSQYNALGGLTSNFNAGIAPVLDFASNAPLTSGLAAGEPAAGYDPSEAIPSILDIRSSASFTPTLASSLSAGEQTNGYLPPIKRT